VNPANDPGFDRVKLRSGRVIAEGHWDARGTLGVDRDVPVGLTDDAPRNPSGSKRRWRARRKHSRFIANRSGSHKTRRWRKANSNRWSHLLKTDTVFRTPIRPPPGRTAPDDEPAQNGMRSHQPFERLLVDARRHRYLLIAASLPLLGASGTSGSNPLSSSGESANSRSQYVAEAPVR
jgi:hypothetical protein